MHGGLPTVQVFQVVLHLMTIGLLGYLVARRFQPAAGLLAAVLFALLMEPAFFTGRVLNCTLQLLLILLLWLVLLRAQRRSSPNSWAFVGLLAGLNCLANPPMLLATALLCLWAWGQDGWRRGAANAAILAGVAALVISPATIHNYKVSGEFIPISAQAGITFAHGNAPQASGIYTPLEGISTARERLNADALRVYSATTGQPPTWNGANRFYFRRGLAAWRANVPAALRLLGRKAYWFISGRYYDDVYSRVHEIQDGLVGRLRLAPLPVAWLTLPALVTLAFLARHPRRYAPELILSAVPLLVVILFMFSPRYRLPAVPVMAAACAWGIWELRRWRAHPKWSLTFSCALLIGVALGPLNRAVGFDRPDDYRADYCHILAGARWTLGQHDQAIAAFRETLRLRPDYTPAQAGLGHLLAQLGRYEEAVPHLQQALHADPTDGGSHAELGRTLLALNRPNEALDHLQTAVQLMPEDSELRDHLGRALVRTGDMDGAIAHGRIAVQLDQTRATAHFNLGSLLCADGDMDGGLTALRRANELAPDDALIASRLAWHLATMPRLPTADRATALQLAQRAADALGDRSPQILDTLAAALAANGHYADAISTLERTIALCGEVGMPGLVPELRARLDLYRAGQPYVAPVGRPLAP